MAASPLIDLGRMPVPGPHLVGREGELVRLDTAWEDPSIHVLSLVAFGGVGKSALVSRWLDNMAADGWRGAERVLDWSFFSQGSEGQVATAEPFVDYALRALGDADPTAGSPHDRGVRLARLVRERRTLLVLDGIEPLQYGSGPLTGRLKDPGLAALLKGLAGANPGLCLVTTREAIADLNSFPRTAPRLDLESLSPLASVELLRLLGVVGKEAELRAAAAAVKHHALTLTLLGNFLRQAHGGDVRKRREIDLRKADERQGGQAFRVIGAYARWLGEGPELAILRLLGFFDRPAAAASLAALRAAPGVTGLNDSLAPLSDEDWQLAVACLRDHGLLAAEEARAPGSLDAHPLVRAYFSQDLEQHRPDAWREGNLRLFEQLRQSAPDFPDTLEAMQPLYEAIPHGCRAGRQQEALDDVYHRRISRGGGFGLTQLGAFGFELTALAAFFDRLWDRPSPRVSPYDQNFLLGQVGFLLRGMGRVIEAARPMQASLESALKAERWKQAAINAGNLSQNSLTLGEVATAVAFGEQCVQLAKRSGDDGQTVIALSTHADALHQAGRWAESGAAFNEAEELQQRLSSSVRYLYSFRGYLYCDLLLNRSGGLEGLAVAAGPLLQFRQACLEVVQRASESLAMAQAQHWLLAIALGHLALASALFGRSVAAAEQDDAGQADLGEASKHLDRSVDGLRMVGEDDLPRALLARAGLRTHIADFAGAAEDLDEAQEIAERSSMKLFECDAHLGWTRLHLGQGQARQAREHLDLAARLVRETGYGRREREIADLEGRVAGLPPDPVEVPMKDFFVSYNRTDRSWAEWIAWTVEDAGYTSVLQAWDFLPGGNFALEMQKATTGTRKTIMVLSDAYLEAVYTQPEWAAVFARDPRGDQRLLIPVRVARCSPDGLLKTMIYADLVGLGEAEAKDMLLAAVSDRERAKPSRPSAFPGAARGAGASAPGADGRARDLGPGDSGGLPPAATDGRTRDLGPAGAPAAAAAYPGAAPPAGKRALTVWREKLDFLLEQEALITDPAQRFALEKQIEQARQKVQSLGG